jgi:hypothetical protein
VSVFALDKLKPWIHRSARANKKCGPPKSRGLAPFGPVETAINVFAAHYDIGRRDCSVDVDLDLLTVRAARTARGPAGTLLAM